MAATVYTNATANSLEFTLTDETSVIVTSYARDVNAVKTEARNAENDVCAVAYSGITGAISIEGYVNGTVAMEIAGVLTLSNDTSSFGLTNGTILIDSIGSSHSQGEFKKISIKATQYSETLS